MSSAVSQKSQSLFTQMKEQMMGRLTTKKKGRYSGQPTKDRRTGCRTPPLSPNKQKQSPEKT